MMSRIVAIVFVLMCVIGVYEAQAADYMVTAAASQTSAYTFSGSASGDNPSFSVQAGSTVTFDLTNVASIHPFWIIQSLGTFTDSNQASGVTYNPSGQRTGSTLTWTVPSTTGQWFYQCENHSNMHGTISVVSSDSGSSGGTTSTLTSTSTSTSTGGAATSSGTLGSPSGAMTVSTCFGLMTYALVAMLAMYTARYVVL